jgi:hypothetical protein
MVAVIILKRWVQGDGVIATGTSPWLGGSRYWAVLRKGAPKVRKTLDDFAASVPSPAPESLFKPISAEIGTVTSSAIGGNTLSVSAASPAEVALAFEAREGLGSKCNWIFEVDFSINSKFPRLFVYSIRDKTLYKYKCAHGGGGKNGSPHDGRIREVSNVPNSGCSSLGVIRTGENYDSDVVGEAVRLHGLSPTNSKMLSRGVVLHGGQYVFDDEANSDKSISGRSRGCLVVNDRYIDRESGGELIEWLKDGSIGVAHYAGEFKLPV